MCTSRMLDQCVIPHHCPPSFPTTFHQLFDRDARTQLDSITPVVDGVEFKRVIKSNLVCCVDDADECV